MNSSRGRMAPGFTLVEMMIGLAILASLFGAIYQFFLKTQSSFHDETNVIEAQGNARLALEAIAADLRQASYGKDATQASVSFAGVDSVAFVADLYDSIPGAEIVSLYLGEEGDSGTANPTDRILHKIVLDTTGAVVIDAPIAYGLASDGLSFRYFDDTGDTLTFPILAPDQVAEVEVAVTAETPNVTKTGDYMPVTFSTTVYPRNLPFSPSKSKPRNPTITAMSSPNCASMTVTWTTPTHNTDGSTLRFNDISHFNVYFGTNIDNLNLDTRVARNINSWTVDNLDASASYVFAVTCVTNSKVESGAGTQSGSPGGAAPAAAPAALIASTVGGAITLFWGRVTHDNLGGLITASIAYDVYRSSSGGVPISPGSRIATGVTDTSYVDVPSGSCGTFYYRVAAKVCGAVGDGSDEVFASVPAGPACVPSVTAVDGPGFGEVTVGWSVPRQRSDGSPLSVSEISGYKVAFGTTSGALTDTLWTGGGSSVSGLLTGLETCMTYFVNVIAVDDCGNKGNVCAGNQRVAWTTTPCDVAPPATPNGLFATEADRRIDLTWGTSHDCDIAGYRIYYDRLPGPPYNGDEADQGPSPIEVDFAQAIIDSSVSAASLTGLSSCEDYYIAISAIDQCSPPHESPLTIAVTAQPTCTPCFVANACIADYASGSGNVSAHGDVANAGVSNLSVQRMALTWKSGNRLVSVYAAGTKVWAADGTAGGDGAMTPPTSPRTINVADWSLPSSATDVEPIHLQFDFDGSALNDSIVVDLDTGGPHCGFVIRGCPTIFTDDFEDDPNFIVPNNWTVLQGTMTTAARRFRSSTTSDTRAKPTLLPAMSNYTVEAQIEMSGTNSSRRAGLMLRYADTNNYYQFDLRPASSSAVLSKRVAGGSVTTVATATGVTVFDSFRHVVRATVNGSELRFWIDGVPILWSGVDTVTDGSLSSGGFTLYSRNTSSAHFDNLKVYHTCGGCQ